MSAHEMNPRAAGGADAATRRLSWRRPGKGVLWGAVGIAVLIAGAIYGVHWWTVGRFLESTNDAYVRADMVVMSPRVSGYVTAVAVQDNQRVKAGAVLVRIDDRDYRAKVARAQAAVDAAKATLDADRAAIANIDAQTVQQNSVIAQAEAQVRSAEADAQRAELDYRRYQNLVRQQVASRQRLENASADYTKAEAAIARTRAAVAAQKGLLPVLQTRRQQARAHMDQTQAALKGDEAALRLARIDLENTAIRAPIDGVIGQRVVRIGQFLEPGQPILAVVPLQAAFVVANYKETQIGHMHPGQPAEIVVDTFSDTTLHGRVLSFSPASGSQFALLPPDNATGNFTKIVQRIPVKIVLNHGEPFAGRQRPGMSVTATVDTRDDGDGGAQAAPAADQADVH
jgi:membrane fusion protein (multidrug efflux system)